ncbi:carbohydrate kinase family protein [Aquibacillus salsiterrae]|uniref:Sugar kinase n=1 Tax=Aquibacillus salsiterrae TaxID=2950439 RepID=A0A9X3WCR0_9BACI|nr:sugar kinase [Aquibacillus salsiterrae]MDC3417440.1 sugar kinase [Aquibacillus salsiterrae]
MFHFDRRIEFQNKDNDILTVGELLVDMISDDYNDDHESDSYRKFFGGSPSNIAMNVKKLGVNSLVASAVGEDGLGTFLINHLKSANIDTQCVQRVDYSTSMVLVNKSKGTPIPTFYREADYHLAYTPEIENAIAKSKVVHFSCWPISRTPVRETVEKVMAVARKNNLLVGFDPNYHPMIWQKGENGVEYVKKIISKVDIVKPSEDDAERIFGKDSHQNQMQKFLDLGAKLVIMTLGKDGALVSNGQETLQFDSLATEIVDTTGAGDAFWSGFYTALIKGKMIRDALELGFAVSAFKLQHTGAVVDLPKLEDLQGQYHL